MNSLLKFDNDLCYLCGQEMKDSEVSNMDHVISELFFEKEQPKQKGSEYWGKLTVHKACNKIWGEKTSRMEDSCLKSLKLIGVLYNSLKGIYHKEFKVTAIEEGKAGFLDDCDKKFFGLIDLTKKDYTEISSLKVFKEQSPINPFVKPVNISLSVLSKNAAAVLVKKNLIYNPDLWRIFALPIIGLQDVEDELGLKRVGKELRYNLETKTYGNSVIIFSYDRVAVVFGFTDFKDDSIRNDIKVLSRMINHPVYFFESKKINDMLNYDWLDAPYDFN